VQSCPVGQHLSSDWLCPEAGDPLARRSPLGRSMSHGTSQAAGAQASAVLLALTHWQSTPINPRMRIRVLALTRFIGFIGLLGFIQFIGFQRLGHGRNQPHSVSQACPLGGSMIEGTGRVICARTQSALPSARARLEGPPGASRQLVIHWNRDALLQLATLAPQASCLVACPSCRAYVLRCR
jgi:hypothetical protein